MTIEDNFYLNGCSDDDVISLYGKLYKVEALKTELTEFLESEGEPSASYPLSQMLSIRIDQQQTLALLTEGTESEILKVASSGWTKGRFKLKMALEFIPDEPEIQDKSESTEYKLPIDEIRNHPSFPNS